MKRIFLFVLVLLFFTSISNAELTAYFMDVGQGAAVLLDCDGEFALIDGGPPSASRLIVAYLRSQGVERLEYVIATHAHADHVGGLSGALAVYPTSAVYCPVAEYDTKAFRDFARYAGETCPIGAGDSFSLGGATLDIVGPVRKYRNENDISVVTRVIYGETAMLLTGDIEWDAEHDLADADITADVLQVSHHGSDTSSSYVLLRAVMPSVAVIQCAGDNPYGHPHEAVLSRLRDADAIVYRTDVDGHIIVISDGKTCTVETR